MDKARRLRESLRRSGAVVAVGAHDALSARLIERAGFDAVWASGFAISAAQFALPDANILTMTESLETTCHIVRATNLPVIADCDNGYGNAINVMRTVSEYEAAGVAAISIEDIAAGGSRSRRIATVCSISLSVTLGDIGTRRLDPHES